MKKIITGIVLMLIIGISAFTFKNSITQQNLTKLLVVYSAYDDEGKITISRLGKNNDGGYAVPLKALQLSDTLMGYGIANDCSFEEQFSEQSHKPSYGFDCGITDIKTKNKQFTLIKECIANDTYLYANQTSTHQITSYNQQLDALNLNNKKIFIKMDIEGAEYQAFEDILRHAPDITGIVLEIHFTHRAQIEKAVRLLSQINQNFLLVHLHGNNCTDTYFSTKRTVGKVPAVLELTYINKQLIKHYHLATEQTHPTSMDMPNCLSKPDVQFEILTS